MNRFQLKIGNNKNGKNYGYNNQNHWKSEYFNMKIMGDIIRWTEGYGVLFMLNSVYHKAWREWKFLGIESTQWQNKHHDMIIPHRKEQLEQEFRPILLTNLYCF